MLSVRCGVVWILVCLLAFLVTWAISCCLVVKLLFYLFLLSVWVLLSVCLAMVWE